MAGWGFTGQPGPEGTISFQESEGCQLIAKDLLLEPGIKAFEFCLPLWSKFEKVAYPL